MRIQMMDGTVTHVQITPGGIAVLNVSATDVYWSTGEMNIAYQWAEAISQKEGVQYRPNWSSNIISNCIAHTQWFYDPCRPSEDEATDVVCAYLDEVDRLHDLHLEQLYRRAACLQNYQIGSKKSLSSVNDSIILA